MPKGNKSLVATVTVRDGKGSQNNKKKKRSRKGPKRDARVAAFMRQIADPCGPVLTAGQYGSVEGVVVRVHRTKLLSPTGTASCGYVIWDPERTPTEVSKIYPQSTTAYRERNLFGFVSDASNTIPTNTQTLPYGSASEADFTAGVPMTTAVGLWEPGMNWVQQAIVQDTRCLSACMRMTSTGKAMDTSGQFCLIDNLSLGALFPNNGGASVNTPTVDDMFTYASSVHAFTKDSIEIKWRPTETSGQFRTETDGTVHVYDGNVSNFTSDPSETAISQSARFVGIAWRGVDTSVGHPFVFDFIKNVESRLAPQANMAMSPPVQVSNEPLVKEAVRQLDRRLPNWATAQEKSTSQVISELAFGPAGGAVQHGLAALGSMAYKAFTGGSTGSGPLRALGGL